VEVSGSFSYLPGNAVKESAILQAKNSRILKCNLNVTMNKWLEDVNEQGERLRVSMPQVRSRTFSFTDETQAQM
jgi:hypothetical protein